MDVNVSFTLFSDYRPLLLAVCVKCANWYAVCCYSMCEWRCFIICLCIYWM